MDIHDEGICKVWKSVLKRQITRAQGKKENQQEKENEIKKLVMEKLILDMEGEMIQGFRKS